ncbi:MAG TPA: MFS transporter [Rhizomicrobium sp.]|jgi:MFS family permease|nr:MFS transporter [Rhizomicrobium sp.]
MNAERLTARSVAAAVIGNALEFYDFVVYTFFAIQIGHVFFPAHSAYLSLMASLGTFGVGFVMRPIGGILIGRYADRVGRKPAMQLCLVLMGIAILGVAAVPSYAAIGVAAPLLIVVARMAQGFALGGQVGSTTAFLLEAAPASQRGYYAGWQTASQYCAMLTGGIVGTVLSIFMSSAELDAYGWRIAFALGGLALPFGLFLIRGVTETLHLPEGASPVLRPERSMALWLEHRRIILLGLVVLASATIFTYVTNYMTTYAEHVLHLSVSQAFVATLAGGVSGIAGALFGAWLSDRIGRWPVLVWPRLLFILLVWPLYAWMAAERSLGAVLVATVVLITLGSVSFGPFSAAMTESLPKHMRGTGYGTIYAISIAIFGGSAQLIVTWLIHKTGSPLAPAWYLIVSGLVGLFAVVLMPETAPARAAIVAAAAE